MSCISIIIPVLNEQAALLQNLPLLQRARDVGHEIIVVDGGSADDSVGAASALADQVLTSKAGRAAQMNTGAQQARGDILMFLHIDTVLPVNAFDAVTQIAQGSHRWGRFDVRLSGARRVFRLIEFMINLRSRVSGVATGDQTLFIRADEFKAVGGFPHLPLMEDVALTKALRKRSSGLCLRDKVITSSRRWEAHGVLSTILLMWRLRLLYVLGVSPHKIHAAYTKKSQS